MSISKAIAGEDIPIRVSYTDPDTGNSTDPDDPGVTWPTVTITDEDDTEQVSAAVMTQDDTGEFEYVWDTATDGSGAGVYTIEVEAEFNSQTKISKDTMELE